MAKISDTLDDNATRPIITSTFNISNATFFIFNANFSFFFFKIALAINATGNMAISINIIIHLKMLSKSIITLTFNNINTYKIAYSINNLKIAFLYLYKNNI